MLHAVLRVSPVQRLTGLRVRVRVRSPVQHSRSAAALQSASARLLRCAVLRGFSRMLRAAAVSVRVWTRVLCSLQQECRVRPVPVRVPVCVRVRPLQVGASETHTRVQVQLLFAAMRAPANCAALLPAQTLQVGLPAASAAPSARLHSAESAGSEVAVPQA